MTNWRKFLVAAGSLAFLNGAPSSGGSPPTGFTILYQGNLNGEIEPCG